MAYISEAYKFLFVMSPRTGCTSIAYGILVPHLKVARVPWKDILDENGRLLVDSKHSTLADLLDYGLIAKEKPAQLFKFCAVRNPFDSLVSLYVKNKTTYAELVDDKDSFLHRKPRALEDVRRSADMSFSEWVTERYTHPSRVRPWRSGERVPVRPQHMYGRYLAGMDHVMQFERLHEDLDEVLRKLGAPTGLEMPNLNPTPRDKDYRSYYTDAARKLVEQVFRPDMERFGYRF
ncbi:MAG: sulfotransferase family 2 domain-containing protein [Actinomycetota bacterium]